MKIRGAIMSCAGAIAGALLLVAGARADVRDANEAEVDFFIGRWAVGPADAPGFETITGAPDCARASVVIERAGASGVRRVSTLRDGGRQAVEFDVKSFGGNFPFWVKGGAGGPVARRLDADAFLLASVRDGRADWTGALKHVRCR
ncbi:MAG: hypothetical protein ACK4MV_20900 [Beijerinckiaceae bacterium]